MNTQIERLLPPEATNAHKTLTRRFASIEFFNLFLYEIVLGHVARDLQIVEGAFRRVERLETKLIWSKQSSSKPLHFKILKLF